jgi:hypothetical protein
MAPPRKERIKTRETRGGGFSLIKFPPRGPRQYQNIFLVNSILVTLQFQTSSVHGFRDLRHAFPRMIMRECGGILLNPTPNSLSQVFCAFQTQPTRLSLKRQFLIFIVKLAQL